MNYCEGKEVVFLHEIFYTQDSIGKRFTHGPYAGMQLDDRRINKQYLLNFLKITRYKGQLFTLNNRTLFVLRGLYLSPKVYSDYICCKDVVLKIKFTPFELCQREFFKRFTTTSNGNEIVVRGIQFKDKICDPGLNRELYYKYIDPNGPPQPKKMRPAQHKKIRSAQPNKVTRKLKKIPPSQPKKIRFYADTFPYIAMFECYPTPNQILYLVTKGYSVDYARNVPSGDYTYFYRNDDELKQAIRNFEKKMERIEKIERSQRQSAPSVIPFVILVLFLIVIYIKISK